MQRYTKWTNTVECFMEIRDNSLFLYSRSGLPALINKRSENP